MTIATTRTVGDEPAATAAPSSPGWRTHYALAMLLFVYTMSYIDRQIMSILIEPIKTEFHVSDSAMGLLTGLAFALFYSALAIPFGRFADRSNRRNFIAICCGAWSVMTALCGMATGYWTLALARAGVAIGEAGGVSPSLSMIPDHYPPDKRARAMSIFLLGPQLGIVFGLGLGGWIAQQYGWRQAFFWMALPGILAALLLRFTTHEPQRGRYDILKGQPAAGAPTESIGAIMRDLWASTAFSRIALAGLLVGFAGYGIGIWTPAFLVRSHGMSLQGAGMVMGVMGGASAVVGTVASGWLCDLLSKRDPRWRMGVPILGCLIAFPAGLAFYLLPSGQPWMLGNFAVPRAMGFYMLFAVTAVFWTGPLFAALAGLVESHRRATAMATFSLLLALVGGGLGPLLVGLLSDYFSAQAGVEALRWALSLSMSMFFFSAIAFLWAMKPYVNTLVAPSALNSRSS